LDPSEQLVSLELLGREVAEVLVDPIRYERADDTLLPPRLGPHLGNPGLRDVPIVVDVVIVEDHGRGYRGEEPPDGRVLPGVPVEVGVLLEVRHFFSGRLAGVAPGADEVAGSRGYLVGVDLVPEQEECVGPRLARFAAHLEGERVQGVAPVPALGQTSLQRVRRFVRGEDAAGAEGEVELPVRGDGPDRGRREGIALFRPDLLSVER
jgi:hypothetical protein